FSPRRGRPPSAATGDFLFRPAIARALLPTRDLAEFPACGSPRFDWLGLHLSRPSIATPATPPGLEPLERVWRPFDEVRSRDLRAPFAGMTKRATSLPIRSPSVARVRSSPAGSPTIRRCTAQLCDEPPPTLPMFRGAT